MAGCDKLIEFRQSFYLNTKLNERKSISFSVENNELIIKNTHLNNFVICPSHTYFCHLFYYLMLL